MQGGPPEPLKRNMPATLALSASYGPASNGSEAPCCAMQRPRFHKYEVPQQEKPNTKVKTPFDPGTVEVRKAMSVSGLRAWGAPGKGRVLLVEEFS